MPRTFSAVLLASLLASGAAADDDNLSANTLYDACTADTGEEQGFCVGYLIGFHEGRKFGSMTALNSTSSGVATADELDLIGDVLAGYCLPPGVQYNQLFEIAINFMRDNPETRHETARSQVWQSFVEAFPCE